MPTISREELGAQHAKLTIQVDRTEIEPGIKSKLKEYSKTISIKGFRPGFVPESVVKARFGSNILQELIGDKVNGTLTEYLKEQELDLIGQPIPVPTDQRISINDITDYSFSFEIGYLAPFEVQGLDESNVLDFYRVLPEEQDVTHEWERVVRRAAKTEPAPDGHAIGESDSFMLNLEELENGQVKEGGLTRADVEVDMGHIRELAKKAFLGKKVGDHADLDFHELEDHGDDAHNRRHILDIDPEVEVNPMFRMTISSISVLVPAELNEEFFQNNFGPEVTDEASAKDLIRSFIQRMNDNSSEVVFHNLLTQSLLENNQLELPKAFLKKMMLSNSPELTEEAVDAQMDQASKALAWSFLKSKIVKLGDVRVMNADVDNVLKARMQRLYGISDERFFNMLKQRFYEDEKMMDDAYTEALDQKMLAFATSKVTRQESFVTKEELMEKNKAYLKAVDKLFGQEGASENE